MKMIPRSPLALRLVVAAAALATTFAGHAQTLARRLSVAPTATAARVPISGSVSGRVAHSAALGHLPGEVQLTGMSLMLKPTAAQSAALKQLLADQQNPASSSYHQWLTPAQYGARFGLADEDLAVLTNWLQARGFTVDSVAPSRNRIVFSGTSSAVEVAFGTSMQRYQRGQQTFFENSSEVQIPAALSDVIGSVSGLSSYHLQAPMAQHLAMPMSQAVPLYTTGSGKHYLVPWDVRQIYGSNTLVGSGSDGTGIKIGVLGQSAVSAAQLTFFQQKTGQTVKSPTLMLVPNTGTSNLISGDEGESELDLEYASGSAPGANVVFIYTGCGTATSTTPLTDSSSCNNNGVFDSMAYAITNNVAPILTLSYGSCETENASFIATELEPLLQQANTQGQTFIASSGDTGAASCESVALPTIATNGISVSYPASSTYVTGVGGTQLNSDAATYWSATNNSFAGSANGYIPEVAWDDTVAYKSFSTSGGGASAIFGKPSWQAGTGVPADNYRDVPDVSLPASVIVNPYVTCTADSNTPCTDTSVGFTTGGGSLVGGTSVAAPNFAGILAIIEQANGGGALGNINPSLYALARGASASAIFHDITSGNNIVPCAGGTTGCSSTVASVSGTMGYSAGVGYDQVTGLGSVAVPALQAGLKTTTGTGGTTVTPSIALIPADTTPVVNTAIAFQATVTGTGAVPTGTVSFSVDGTAVGSAVTLSSGVAVFNYGGFGTAGAHTVVATYSGSSTFSAASATISITAIGGNNGLTLAASAPTLTVASGGSGTETLTITSTNSYTGPVSFTAALVSSTGPKFAGCYSLTPSTVSPAPNTAVTAAMTIFTSTAACTTSSRKTLSSSPIAGLKSPSVTPPVSGGLGRTGLVVLSAGLLGCFMLRRRIRIRGGLLVMLGLMVALGLNGCSGGSSNSGITTSTPTTTTTGTYVIQVTASDVATGNISASTSFTVAVQ
jgi:subtilase family serine protease